MKFVVLLSCLLVLFPYAAPEEETVDQNDDEELVLDQEPEIRIEDDGRFSLRLVDKDGTTYVEEGVVLTDEKTGEEVVISKKGTYSYPGKDGKFTRLAYDIDSPVVPDVNKL